MNRNPVSTPTSTAWRIGFFFIDLIALFVFALAGRSSHGESLAGAVATALPFWVACVAMWLIPCVHRNPLRFFPATLTVWLGSALGGELLRVAFGGSTALSFILVTIGVTAILFFGWRAVALYFSKRKSAKE